MKYTLNEEQIREIVNDYCNNVSDILLIQDKVNEFDIVKDESDFFDIVANVSSNCQSSKMQFFNALKGWKEKEIFENSSSEELSYSKISEKVVLSGDDDIKDCFHECINVDEMIMYELRDRYDNVELKKQKILCNKKRHF